MTPAQEILKLIETVDPTDSVKLDEIDAWVWCYLLRYKFLRYEMYGEHTGYSIIKRMRFYYKNRSGKEECYCVVNIDKPSRSRDILKEIRPEGWTFMGGETFGSREFFCHCKQVYHPFKGVDVDHAPTEELAELHAIIQAIEFERTQKGEG